MVIVVIRLQRLPPPRFALPGKIPDFDFGFTIDGQPQDCRILVSRLIRLGNMGKNGIGFRQLLLWLYFLGFLRR
jgi:hypothetical protein